MKKTIQNYKGQKGLTLIEIICVLVLIGIISLVAVVRMLSVQDVDRYAQLEVIKAHLRIAQARAMSTGEPYGINFNSTTSYFLFRNSAPNTALLLPGEDNTTVSLSVKKSALVITSAPLIITYDAYGSPGTSDINIETNGGTINITKNTGFIK
ncbi:MAG TPA: prepilin-type N-terminal cleavage/methylation domain-containing protein [Smithella sp.]|nr:prepilin-type N-terminal cleavage/methylation domain-containing protein [Smithella sp.]